MTDLGKRLQVRQIVIATALTYFKRFYTKNSYRRTEPYLVAATCMYLACKIEESPHHIKTVISEMKKLSEDIGGFPYENQKVAEMEFYLMEELNFNMIVFHPYRTLKTLADEVLGDKNKVLQLALFIVNDTYRTDMCLLYPPHVIAAAALYFSIAIEGENQDDDSAFGGSNGQGVMTRNSRKELAAASN
ncbi:3844_t:CDS:2, partial [Acaulospora morrowiae]